ncbi:diacylglycerol kinase family lipid kinase [Bacteroidetes/Chlorobi group bacterium ChocPot_Mid]|nr:MAG: diacylglycerol kinase family lipid kinase [Bacteroidetes/Chlorobi group bacterium ChocPot_Mid]
MANNKYFIIINPNAGSGLGIKKWNIIASLLAENKIEYDFQFSEFSGHIIEIAKNTYKNNYKKIIIVGGDGSLNEVINGLLSISANALNEITVSMIPVGTGNDWCRSHKIPSNTEDAIKLIIKNNIIRQDLAKATYNEGNQIQSRYFANISGIGFDAHVAIKSNLDKKNNKSGILVYLKNVISSLINYKSVDSIIEFNEKVINCKLFLLSVGKGKYNGGAMKQLPFADLTDGFIDFTLIENISRFDVLTQLPRLYKGTHINHPKISTYKTKKVSISTIDKIFLEVDGETFGHSPFEFEVIPNALKVITGL